MAWLAAVASRAALRGRIQPSLFGGPTTRTAQGSLIGSAIEVARRGPLEGFLEAAYDSGLRHALQHNDVRVDAQNDSVRCLSSGDEWSGRQVLQLVQVAHALIQSTYLVCQRGMAMAEAEEHGLQDCGVVSATYHLPNGLEPPVIYLP